MQTSRRELLTLLLGAPLATEACRALRPREVPGSIVGGNAALGHRLRAPGHALPTVEQARTSVRRVQVAIVGAGPSGLCAAWWLERHGVRDFLLLDLERQAGGTSTYGADAAVPYPWGAHYVPLPTPDNPELVALLRDAGALEVDPADPRRVTPHETALVREPTERLFLGDRWYEGLFPMAGAGERDLQELARFETQVARWVALRDARGRRAFTLPLARCSDDAELTELDRASVAHWLAREGYTSSRLRWYLDYACRDEFGARLETTSAWALAFYFAARVPAPGEQSAPFLSWPEGNGHLVRHLERVAGDRVELGRLVTDVVGSRDVVELALVDERTGELERVVAEHAILAVPTFIAARLVRGYSDSRPSAADAFSYSPWLVANLHLTRRPQSPGFPFAWDNVLYDSPSLGYVVATHQSLADLGPTVWTYYFPLTDGDPRTARERLLAADHRGWCDAVVSDLGRAHRGLSEATERVDLWRWGHAMVRPTPGFIWGQHRRAAQRHLGRVHFAHADLSGMPLFEEAQSQGLRAAEEVLGALRG